MLRTAFDLGITLIDSAEVYDNEELLGRVIRSLPNAPDDLLVSTKFGHGKGFSAGQIRDSVERSLAAFGIESIPVFMLHDPRGDADLDVIYAPDGALPELRRLQDEGLVGHVGIATGTLPPLLAAVESDEFDVIQFPRLYTLLNQSAKTSGLLEKARSKNIGTILTSPFTGNILGTGVRGVDSPLYSFWDAQPEVVEAVGRLQDAADAAGLALPEAAMAYALAEPLIDVVVIGVKDAAELRQDVAMLDRRGRPRRARAPRGRGAGRPGARRRTRLRVALPARPHARRSEGEAGALVHAVVVGAGSAGSAVAGRLAERGCTVTLLEAGPDWRSESCDDEIRRPRDDIFAWRVDGRSPSRFAAPGVVAERYRGRRAGAVPPRLGHGRHLVGARPRHDPAARRRVRALGRAGLPGLGVGGRPAGLPAPRGRRGLRHRAVPRPRRTGARRPPRSSRSGARATCCWPTPRSRTVTPGSPTTTGPARSA